MVDKEHEVIANEVKIFKGNHKNKDLRFENLRNGIVAPAERRKSNV